MKRKGYFLFLFIVSFFPLCSCGTVIPASLPETSKTDTIVDNASPADTRETVLTVNNPTPFTVYFDGGQKVERRSTGSVSLYVEDATLSGGFDVLYEIPLSDTVALYYKGDHRTIRENQTFFEVNAPYSDENYGVFFKITNKANNAVSFVTGRTVNPSWEQRGSPLRGDHLTWTDKREFSRNASPVFKVEQDTAFMGHVVRDSREDIPVLLRSLQKNHLYTFEYESQTLSLLDGRPLHRIGESAWTETIGESDSRPLFAGSGAITLLSPASQTISRRSFDSSGREQESSVSLASSGGDFTLSAAIPVGENGTLLAGYTENGGGYDPLVSLYAGNGALRSTLAPSDLPEYHSAFFLTAAQKDEDSWLVAGGARDLKGAGYGAYLRMIREEGSGLVCDWELGPGGFNSHTPEDGICHEISSAVYDKDRGRWLVTGYYKNMRTGQNGAYLAEVSGAGHIQKLDTSYINMEFNKLSLDAAGSWYLAGQEYKGSGSYAVLIKYGADGIEQWRQQNQPSSHSWYQDAIVDETNRQIVLCGTMRALAEDGSGGVPFIEAVDMETGTPLWREDAETWRRDGALLAETTLALNLSPAPDYGYALILSALAKGEIQKPYILVRVNSQGKFYGNGEQK